MHVSIDTREKGLEMPHIALNSNFRRVKIAESSTPEIQHLTHYKAFTSGLVRNIEVVM